MLASCIVSTWNTFQEKCIKIYLALWGKNCISPFVFRLISKQRHPKKQDRNNVLSIFSFSHLGRLSAQQYYEVPPIGDGSDFELSSRILVRTSRADYLIENLLSDLKMVSFCLLCEFTEVLCPQWKGSDVNSEDLFNGVQSWRVSLALQGKLEFPGNERWLQPCRQC